MGDWSHREGVKEEAKCSNKHEVKEYFVGNNKKKNQEYVYTLYFC